MSAPSDLSEIYEHEMQDLWSANDQMVKAVKQLAAKAGDKKLRQRLEKSIGGIEKHTDKLKQLLEAAGGEVSKEHCKGMEGLVKEALKHAVEEDFDDDEVRDVVIVAQYQRMSHYGIAGFGTAAAYAEALGRKKDAEALHRITKEIYSADENMSDLAERSLNLRAKEVETAE
jgi:ferritin-like metal-binding protein YciE